MPNKNEFDLIASILAKPTANLEELEKSFEEEANKFNKNMPPIDDNGEEEKPPISLGLV